MGLLTVSEPGSHGATRERADSTPIDPRDGPKPTQDGLIKLAGSCKDVIVSLRLFDMTPACGATMFVPPLFASAAGMRGRPSGRPLRFKGSYQLVGLCTIPRASGTWVGNWLARSAARRIGL